MKHMLRKEPLIWIGLQNNWPHAKAKNSSPAAEASARWLKNWWWSGEADDKIVSAFNKLGDRLWSCRQAATNDKHNKWTLCVFRLFSLFHRFFPVVIFCVVKQQGVKRVGVEYAGHLRKQRS